MSDDVASILDAELSPAPATHQIDDGLVVEMIARADAEIRLINQRIEGVLMYYMRKHGMEGQYQIGPDRRSLLATQPETSFPAAAR